MNNSRLTPQDIKEINKFHSNEYEHFHVTLLNVLNLFKILYNIKDDMNLKFLVDITDDINKVIDFGSHYGRYCNREFMFLRDLMLLYFYFIQCSAKGYMLYTEYFSFLKDIKELLMDRVRYISIYSENRNKEIIDDFYYYIEKLKKW